MISLSNDNFQNVLPLNYLAGGLSQAEIETNLGEPKKLRLQINTNLEGVWQNIKDNNSFLTIKFKDRVFGFFKPDNLVTHILPLGRLSIGSDSNLTIGLNKSFVASNGTFQLDESYFNFLDNEKVFYLSDKSKDLTKPYFLIKEFDLGSFGEDSALGDNPVLTIQKLLYQKAIDFFASGNTGIIEKQSLLQNGVLNINYISSSFLLFYGYRSLKLNTEFFGSIQSFCNSLSNDFIFDFLDVEEEQINIKTGIYNNFELLNQIIENNKSLSWRDEGLVLDLATGKYKTLVTIGDFNNQPPKYRAKRLNFDDPFEKELIQIKEIKDLNPLLEVDLKINGFVQEGDKISIEFQEFIKSHEKNIKIFDFSNTQIFRGFNGVDLFLLKG